MRQRRLWRGTWRNWGLGIDQLLEEIPQKWEIKPLVHVLQAIETGGRPKGGVSENSGEIPSLGGENIHEQGGMRYKSVKKIEKTFFINMTTGILEKYDVLINKDGANTGKVGFYNGKFAQAAINEHLFLLRGKEEALNQKFLYYILLSTLGTNQLFPLITGSAQPGLNSKFPKYFKVPLPPIPEQLKIAAIISSVDQAIDKTRVVIAKTERLKKGLMQQLLTRGVPGWHSEWKESKLGEIPGCWEVKRIAEIASHERYSCVGGPFGSNLTSKDYIESIGVPVIRGINLGSNSQKFIDELFVYVSFEKAELLKSNIAYPDDFLITQRGTIGQIGLIPVSAKHKKYIVSQSQMKLTTNSEITSSEYVHIFFTTSKAQRYLQIVTIATGVPHINLDIFRKFPIPIPPIIEQDKIISLISSIDNNMGSLKITLKTLKQIKKGLMQQLLTGKIRVRV